MTIWAKPVKDFYVIVSAIEILKKDPDLSLCWEEIAEKLLTKLTKDF